MAARRKRVTTHAPPVVYDEAPTIADKPPPTYADVPPKPTPATQADADCITAITWRKLLDDTAGTQTGFDALDAGRLAYRVVDSYGKSGHARDEREEALAGAIVYFASRLIDYYRHKCEREIACVREAERKRADARIAALIARAHAALDSTRP